MCVNDLTSEKGWGQTGNDCVMDKMQLLYCNRMISVPEKLRYRKFQETGGMGYVPYFRGKKACG